MRSRVGLYPKRSPQTLILLILYRLPISRQREYVFFIRLIRLIRGQFFSRIRMTSVIAC